MKPTLVIGLALFMLFGCGRQEPAQMTPQEQDVAKNEISEVLNEQLLAQASWMRKHFCNRIRILPTSSCSPARDRWWITRGQRMVLLRCTSRLLP